MASGVSRTVHGRVSGRATVVALVGKGRYNRVLNRGGCGARSPLGR
jgi:hypothetical protein